MNLPVGLATSVVVGALAPVVLASDVPFEAARTISLTADAARSVVCGDIDRDGDIDVVVASSADNTVRIFRNNNAAIPSFTSQTASTSLNSPVYVSLADIDQDGDPDILVGSQGSSDSFAWIQITAGPTGTLSFFTRTLGAGNNPVSVQAADLDKDGDLDIVGASSTDTSVRWFENDGTPTSGAWTARVITSSAGVVSQVVPFDLDEDGDLDVVCAGNSAVLWLENDGTPAAGWVSRNAATSVNSNGVAVGDINGDGRPDIVSISLADDSVRLHRSNGAATPSFTTSVIAAALSNPTGVDLADLDLDGDLDIVLVNATTLGVQWLENNGAIFPTFTLRTPVSPIVQYTGVAVSDLDEDGNPDIVTVSGSDDRVAWLRSDQIHRSFKFEGDARLPIGDLAEVLLALGQPADIDGDGDLDMLVGTDDRTLWYANNGAGQFGTGTQICPELGFSGFQVRPQAIDIDCDGDLDVGGEGIGVNIAIPGVFWRENNGSPQNPSWNRRVIDNDIPDIGFIEAVRFGDLSGDGAPDAIAIASGAFIQSMVVYLNPNPPGILDWQAFPTSLNIGPVNSFGVEALELADLDRDGDLDIFLSYYKNLDADQLTVWYENEGGLNFTERLIDATTVSEPAITDFDDDGDPDVLARAFGGGTVAYVSNGLAQPTFTRQDLLEFSGDVNLADLDLDGDLDTVQILPFGMRLGERVSNSSLTVTLTLIQAGTTLRDTHVIGDFDGDGDPDIALVESAAGDAVFWLRNVGGQFSLATQTPFTEGTQFLPGARRQPIFTIEARHEGRVGDTDAEFAALKLNWQSSFVSAITDDEFNALISQWFVYADNGDGFFNRLNDTLLTQVANTDLDVNGLTIRNLPENISTAVPFGGVKRFFVAIEFTPNAHTFPMRRFRVTHNTDPLAPNPSIGQDRTFDIDLHLQREASVSTGLIFATCPADLSGSSDPNSPEYGVANGVADADDFFFYLDQFEAANVFIADYTSSADPSDPGYGVPDGVVDAADFFFYLDLFALGCS